MNDWTDLKPQERRPRAAGDKLEEGTLLLLAEVRHHGPERGDGWVGQLITPGVVGVGLQRYTDVTTQMYVDEQDKVF